MSHITLLRCLITAASCCYLSSAHCTGQSCVLQPRLEFSIPPVPGGKHERVTRSGGREHSRDTRLQCKVTVFHSHQCLPHIPNVHYCCPYSLMDIIVFSPPLTGHYCSSLPTLVTIISPISHWMLLFSPRHLNGHCSCPQFTKAYCMHYVSHVITYCI